MILEPTDPLAGQLFAAIRGGDLEALAQILGAHEGAARARILGRKRDGGARSTLHLATDWPGYFPCGPQVVRMLIDAGADPSVSGNLDRPGETPLHWAASTDDLDVAVALVEGGADLEAPGSVINGGSPLTNAVAFACWNVAHLLVTRGAHVDQLWVAAALGQRARVAELIAAAGGSGALPADELNHAFWQACHGGQRRMAEYLLLLGADLHWHPDYNDTRPVDIAARGGTQRDLLVELLTERGGRDAPQ